MAVLEAFVYDPLLNWRLIDNAVTPKAAKRSKTTGVHPVAAAGGHSELEASLPDKEGIDMIETGAAAGSSVCAASQPGNPSSVVTAPQTKRSGDTDGGNGFVSNMLAKKECIK